MRQFQATFLDQEEVSQDPAGRSARRPRRQDRRSEHGLARRALHFQGKRMHRHFWK